MLGPHVLLLPLKEQVRLPEWWAFLRSTGTLFLFLCSLSPVALVWPMGPFFLGHQPKLVGIYCSWAQGPSGGYVCLGGWMGRLGAHYVIPQLEGWRPSGLAGQAPFLSHHSWHSENLQMGSQ